MISVSSDTISLRENNDISYHQLGLCLSRSQNILFLILKPVPLDSPATKSCKNVTKLHILPLLPPNTILWLLEQSSGLSTSGWNLESSLSTMAHLNMGHGAARLGKLCKSTAELKCELVFFGTLDRIACFCLWLIFEWQVSSTGNWGGDRWLDDQGPKNL